MTLVGTLLVLPAVVGLQRSHVVSTAEWLADHESMCARQTPAAEGNMTDFSKFCPAGQSGCWPAMYLLGVQKAATTSVADAMAGCGLIAYGATSARTGAVPNAGCNRLDSPCKEVLHTPITTDDGQINATGKELFPLMHDTTRCQETLKHSMPSSIPACQAGQFMEATPLGIGDTPTVATLLAAIPSEYLVSARFAIILREPVARLLSWYNHVKVGGNYYDDDPAAYASFDTFARRETNSSGSDYKRGQAYKLGQYTTYLDHFKSSQHTRRSQLLVLKFEDLVADPANGIKLLTLHYGLPKVLTGVTQLPEDNQHDGPEKVITIKCSTREATTRAYEPYNSKLIAELRADRASGAAPVLEPAFTAFDSEALDCADEERTMGGASSVSRSSLARDRPLQGPLGDKLDRILAPRLAQ